MISKKMLDELIAQINREFYSSYLYLSMASYATSINLEGFAKWLRVQTAEEYSHAMKIYDYVEHQQGRVLLGALAEPPAKFKSVLDIFEKTLAHEKHITSSIHALYSLAEKEKDYATQAFLQWFVSEQVEEEAEAQRVVDRIKMVGDSMSVLLYLDKEMGKRGKD